MKKMKKNKFAALALILPMLAGCSDNNDDPTPTDRTPLSISAGINTRATESTWHQGDAIGVYTLNTGTANVYNNQANFKYTNTSEDGGSAAFNPADGANTAYYPTDGAEVDVFAYYPWQKPGAIDALQVDVTDQTSLPAIDLMTTDKVTGKSMDEPNVALAFEHRLTKLNITLAKGKGADDIDLANARVTLSGTPGTAVYDLYNRSFKSVGQAVDIELKGNKAIVIPTPAGSGVTFVIEAGGKTFNAALPVDVALGTGEEATITIRLKVEGGQVAVGITVDVAEWGQSNPGTGATRVDVVERIDFSALPAGDVFIRTGTLEGVYVWDGTDITDSDPLYWDNLAEGEHTFTLEFIPYDILTGPQPDILVGTAGNVAWGNLIEFGTLAHQNTQFTVVLEQGDTYTDDDEWETVIADATIALLGFEDGDFSYDYLSGTGVNSTIVLPQDITADHKVQLTIAGHTYTMNLSGKFTGNEFRANETYTLTATVNKTGIGISIGSIGDWAPGENGTGDFEY